jgi:cytochrome c2
MPEEACFVLRVSAVTGSADALLASPPAKWQTVFETAPCLPIRSQGHLFNGSQSGGRMAMLDDRTLLLTVGDHEFDGVHSAQPAAQDTASAYGKTLAIDLHTGRARTFTSGHRNAQGLVVTRSGEVWLTEHGPRGGDELNRGLEGANYGWPFETYGTNYGAHFWPLSTAQGRHDRFTAPAYSWLPAIGISNLVEVSSDTLFALWDGDLLVASLVGQTVYRIRVQDGSVRFAEPIAIGERVRDIVQARDGAIVLWLDGGSMAVLDPAPLSSDAGAAHFATLCGGCHMVIGGTAHGVGPDLDGVASRRVASAEKFQYSDALKRLGGRWSADRLDALLREGQRFAPGMTMPDLVINDSATRAAIVRYVRTLR